MKKVTLFLFLLQIAQISFAENREKNNIYSTTIDSVSIAKGQFLFTQNCTSCHQIKVDGIGPRLSGITTITSRDWVKKFIQNPQQKFVWLLGLQR